MELAPDWLTKDAAETLVAVLAILGAAASVVLFLVNQRRLLTEASLARYDSVTTSYIDYQKLCLEHPALQTGWYRFEENVGRTETDEERLQRKLLFDILTSTLERAYLTYLTAPSAIYKSQWPGWDAFARHFAGRDDYRDWWKSNAKDFDDDTHPVGKSGYDVRFEDFMTKLFREKAS